MAGISAAIVVAISIASCLPATSPSTSPSPGALGASDEACPYIDLRTPSGDRIDLNGTWETQKEGTRAGIYYFRQVGSCIWFAGGYQRPTVPDLQGGTGHLTVIFRGSVGSDFVIRGEWIDARDQYIDREQGGTMELLIETANGGLLRLVYIGGDGAQAFIEPGYREEQSWIQISDTGEYPPPDPAKPGFGVPPASPAP